MSYTGYRTVTSDNKMAVELHLSPGAVTFDGGFIDTKLEPYVTKEEADEKYATKEELQDTAMNGVDLDGYLTKEEADKDYATVGHTHDMSAYALKSDIPEEVNLTGYLKETTADGKYAPKSHTHDMSAYALKSDIPEEVNLTGYLKETTADGKYAPKSHTHEDYVTNSELEKALAGVSSGAVPENVITEDGVVYGTYSITTSEKGNMVPTYDNKNKQVTLVHEFSDYQLNGGLEEGQQGGVTQIKFYYKGNSLTFTAADGIPEEYKNNIFMDWTYGPFKMIVDYEITQAGQVEDATQIGYIVQFQNVYGAWNNASTPTYTITEGEPNEDKLVSVGFLNKNLLAGSGYKLDLSQWSSTSGNFLIVTHQIAYDTHSQKLTYTITDLKYDENLAVPITITKINSITMYYKNLLKRWTPSDTTWLTENNIIYYFENKQFYLSATFDIDPDEAGLAIESKNLLELESINCDYILGGNKDNYMLEQSDLQPVTYTVYFNFDDSVYDRIPTFRKIFNFIFPIGAIYSSKNGDTPAIMFGGTWKIVDDTNLPFYVWQRTA